MAIAMPVPGAGRTAAIVVVTSSKHDAVTRTGWTWAASLPRAARTGHGEPGRGPPGQPDLGTAGPARWLGASVG
ncbi:hypothetical protein [Fodinicola feengrottensis]|uniref:hypothetical protein n=1 Tax=Fodinicola feengrottensis TaxID=435914 RepID=UPI0013D6D2CD